MAGRSAKCDLPERLREIGALNRSGCVSGWEEAFGRSPPKYLSIPFMQRVLNQDLQCRVLGGYPAPVRKALRDVLSQAAGKGPRQKNALPGSHLVREWNGRTYRVEVVPSGYILDGQTYGSLSGVARRITGASWSGPRFFGLAAKRSA